MKRTEIRIPLSQIQNLLPTPVSCYAYGGEIITIPPVPIEEIKKGGEIYYIVDSVPDTSIHFNFILATSPSLGRGNKEIRSLYFKEQRVYPMGDA